MNRIYIFGGVAIVLLAIIGGLYAWNTHTAPQPLEAGWKTYTDPNKAFSISYPGLFVLATNDMTGARAILIGDQNKVNYFYIERRDHLSATDAALFSGPYPRIERNLTVAQKILNGYNGVEIYGFISEGHEYADTFLYKQGDTEVSVSLNAHIQGRDTSSLGEQPPNVDEATYQKILKSLTFSK
ncbi:MAG: hypothetical protein JWL75_363 [Parcubacteria group bacterium]|nr:hypothetical protein [Parcubacteria group bacterium]